MKKYIKAICLCVMMAALIVLFSAPISADEAEVTDEISGVADLLTNTDTLDILSLLTLIVFIPSLLIMTTCFTRIIIVLSILRNALGLQQTPPNQVLIGIALFLTLFIMSPVVEEINTEAYIPFRDGEIDQEQMLTLAMDPLREFMLKNTKNEDVNFFLSISGAERPENHDEISTFVIIPAFITSELKQAFLMGFLLYLPFLIIDMVVSSTLMAMGMVMLPPTMISMPFKLMLFVLVNGWQLTFQSLISGFN